MAELVITTFVTLDGVMQAPGGDGEDTTGNFAYGGWVVPHFDEDLGNMMNEIFARADAFLLGRTTYDLFAGYWPHVTDPDDTVATALNQRPRFVASRTRRSFDWPGTFHVDDVVPAVADLKRRFAREVQVHGSWELAQTLIAADLIDEYRLITFPVVVGAGKRLFGPGAVPANFALARSTVTSTGVVVGYYRRAGALQTGMVPPPEAGQAAGGGLG